MSDNYVKECRAANELTNGIDIAPIGLNLGMLQRITIDLTGAC